MTPNSKSHLEFTAVYGLNRLALAALFQGYRRSEDIRLKYIEKEGLPPMMDPNDLLLLPVEYLDFEEKQTKVLNCTSAAQEVIEATTGCSDLSQNIFPQSLGEDICSTITQAVKVEESLVSVESPNIAVRNPFLDPPEYS
jgi:hypothetical protein